MKKVLVALVAILGLVAMVGSAQASSVIGSIYNGADRLYLTTANNGSPGGISTPGLGTSGNPAGMTYLIQDGDQGPVAMVDGVFDGNKFFSGGMTSSTVANMDSQTPSGTWKWFDAHFTNPITLTHFVYRTADAASSRTPDQFQLRGRVADGSGAWQLIYRYDNNGGTTLPWGSAPFPNNTAVLFDSGVDFFTSTPPSFVTTPALATAYKEIRLEIFSSQQDAVGITEWQLAGTAQTEPVVPEPATLGLVALGALGMLIRRK